MSSVFRMGDTVHREAGPWTPQVHRLLTLLHARGVVGVPQALGMDDKDREVLTYLHGEVGASPLAGTQRRDEVLIQAAKLLKSIHEATAEVASQWTTGWRLPARVPAEVICHGDFAPYNCVFLEAGLVGVFDFDFAHPGPRLWDLAYAVYRFAPLADPCGSEGFGTPAEQARRMRIFCDAYGLADRTNLLSMVATRVQSMVDFLLEGQATRDVRRMAAIEAGHLRLYQRDLVYIEQNRAEFESALANAHAARAVANVDDYIASFSPEIQAILSQVRQVVRSAAPQAQEVISYRMPALKQNGILVYFAAFKNHIGLYPPVTGDAQILKAVAPFAGEKGNLRFPFNEPIPYELIARITALRARQDTAKAALRRRKPSP